eukprot:CAMPEP_0174279146 /NCGR_PEP_ID=MMETSP0439-20130205/61871_1 /TAXON_ID=0 /ORGANISM="Stereomyxa ramosa, Strain Chinc5" /LENGTH=49 /DNA_ID=CAMNT_0015371635 /DNA_START=449 /DNA_END=598 /DNA_ORIENTATION=-
MNEKWEDGDDVANCEVNIKQPDVRKEKGHDGDAHHGKKATHECGGEKGA